MKFRMFLVVAAIMACVSISKAEMTYETCAPDGDGVITLKNAAQWSELGTGEYQISMDCVHHSLDGMLDYGHMVGSFTTDGDPNLALITSVDNDTGWTWTDYHINIYMDQLFSIVSPTSVILPVGWTTNITAVTGGGHLDAHLINHAYEGSIDFYSGMPIPNGGTLEFIYTVNIPASVSGLVNFTQEMYPTPEPGALALLVVGMAGLLAFRRRFA